MCRLTIPVATVLFISGTYAQVSTPTPSPPAVVKPAEDPLGRDNPRGCVLGFLRAVERADYPLAAQYLDFAGTSMQAEELARQLQTILNHGLSKGLEALSRAPEGNLKDSFPNDRDRAGFVGTPSGKLEILLDRVQRDTERPVWLFSAETLSDVPLAFEGINTGETEKFVRQFLPRYAIEIKLLSLPLWRWFLILLAVVSAVVLASLMTSVVTRLLGPAIRRMTGQTDDRYLLSLRNPMRLVLLAIVIRILALGAVSLLARTFWARVAHILTIAGASWLLIRFSDIVSNLRSRYLVRTQVTNQVAVLALVHRLFKILVVFVAVALFLHSAGVNVTALLAGLGIGGIALALAAQKTLEDVFGGISIIMRKAVRIGDFCQLADQTGTIEEISLGRTRVRTVNDTVVTIPNSKVSQMSLENYSMRRKIRFHQVFGLRSDTSAEQMRQVLSQVTELLRGDARVENESARIRLIEFGASSLKVEIFAYIKTTDYAAFLEVQEDLMLRIMEIIEASGTSIALPSQLTHMGRYSGRRVDEAQLFADNSELNRRDGRGEQTEVARK